MVKTQFLLMDNLAPLNKIFSMIIQHERQNQLQLPNDDSQILINVVDSKHFGFKFSSAKHGGRVCIFHGKTNHIVNNYFKKHRVPPHMQKQFSTATLNVNYNGSENGSSSHNTDTNDGSSAMPQDQFGVLMDLLHKSILGQVAGNGSSSNQVIVGDSSTCNTHISLNNCSIGSWIIDSDASDLICGYVKWFHSYSEIISINVRLLNGQYLVTKHFGTINLSPIFTVSNVLFIPEFSLNPLPISKLCDFQIVMYNFLAQNASFGKKTSIKMTGSVQRKDKIYYLTLGDKNLHAGSNHISAANVSLLDRATCHFRLGHLSHHKLLSLHSKFPFITFNNKDVCDVCHFS